MTQVADEAVLDRELVVAEISVPVVDEGEVVVVVAILLVVELGVPLRELEDTRLEVETELVDFEAEFVVLVLPDFGADVRE